MKKLTAIILMSGIVFFSSCEKETIKTTKVYETNDITIEFISYEDSRCPLEATCVWEGEAKINLKMTDKNESVNFSLTGIGTETTILDHKVKFLDLLPYPQSGVETPLAEMEVKLQVSKF